jgi:hypothetical protein
MRNGLVVATALMMLAALAASPSWAGWGCQALSATSKAVSLSWADRTEADARAEALNNCQTRQHEQCHITDCKEGVDTEAQAGAIWPHGSRTCESNGPGTPCK